MFSPPAVLKESLIEKTLEHIQKDLSERFGCNVFCSVGNPPSYSWLDAVEVEFGAIYVGHRYSISRVIYASEVVRNGGVDYTADILCAMDDGAKWVEDQVRRAYASYCRGK